MSNIVILGATSAIAEKVARLYARPENNLLLVARNQNALSAISNDLTVRGSEQVAMLTYDFDNLENIPELCEQISGIFKQIDILFIAYGTLPVQSECLSDVSLMQSEISLNYLSVVSILTVLSHVMTQQGSGVIAVVSSVAGDRGRKSNYIYGSAKGGLTIYLQGLRNELAAKGVHVLTIKPGFVDTPMTSGFKKGLLWVKPEKVASDIVSAIENKKNVLYTPWFWRWIMLIIRLIPESIFKKMSL
jgi:short-subunit dehydrogenase